MSFFVTLGLRVLPALCVLALRCVHGGHAGRVAGGPAAAARGLYEHGALLWRAWMWLHRLPAARELTLSS